MKAMIMAGGTGGHIFPAASVATALSEAGYEIRWLGSERGMEGELVPKLGFEFCSLPVTSLTGGILAKGYSVLNLIRAIFISLKIIKKEKPDVVVGFGGYPSAPGSIAALLKKKPLVLHEQNGVPGYTNSKLAKHAKVVLQAFPDTFSQNYPVVGNPVRSEICELRSPDDRGVGKHQKLRVLILGGSQGAVSINELVPDAIRQLDGELFEIRHQAGKNKAESTRNAYQRHNLDGADVFEFIDDMAEVYDWADLVIARSGASTVSELAAAGVASILIPYPWHADRQQFRNAHFLTENSAAQVFEQEELTAEKLAEALHGYEQNRKSLQDMALNAWQIGVRDSANKIVTVIDGLTGIKGD